MTTINTDFDYSTLVVTEGENQNSYVTIEEANILLMTTQASFIPLGTQLEDTDTPYLLESARDLDQLWDFKGLPSDPNQTMAWPRRYVERPGFKVPCEPGWSAPCSQDEWLWWSMRYLDAGSGAIPFLDAQIVPQDIKVAQAQIAVLRSMNKNLVGDNQGDAKGLQLDTGFKIAYVNELRDAADIHKRLAGYGVFLGDAILRAPNV